LEQKKPTVSPLPAPIVGELFASFMVQPVNSCLKFLVDTGSCCSLVPKKLFANSNSYQNNFNLWAANGTSIKTFGTIQL